MLLISTGMLTGACWWISFDESRYLRLLDRISRLSIVSTVIVVIGSLLLVDILFDLIIIIAVLPLMVALVLVLLAMPINLNKSGNLAKLPNLYEAKRAFALIIVSIFIGLFIAEFVFRTTILEPKVPDTEQQFSKLISSSWPHNIPVKKPANTFRIIGLSDSFGRMGRHENYHYLLEDLLLDAGYNVEIINISAVDYGPFDELEILKRFGVRYEPDLVLHGFYVGNDFGVPDTNVMTYLGIGVRMPQGYVVYRPRNFLVVQWTRSFLTVQIDKFRREQESDTDPSKTPGVLSRVGFLSVERKIVKTFQVAPAPERRWVGTVKNLDDIRNEVSRIRAAYILVIHPDQIQIDDKLRRELEQASGLSFDERYDFNLPQHFLSEYCLSREIRCLDLLSAFKAQQAKDLFQPNDIHYSQSGNRLAADRIFEFLQQEQLVSD
jgi:hypothetical protein